MTKKTNEPITLDALPAGSVVELQGKQYPTHPGLLALAHAHGVETITTDLLQYNDGEAILKAKVTGTRGTFEAHGDASASNVSRNIANAVIRMAETRAVNRCLRLYLGIGATTAEELPPDAFQGRTSNTRKATPTNESPAASAARSAVSSAAHKCPSCGGRVFDNRNEKDRGNRPKWSCGNRKGPNKCTGGKDGYSWGSYDDWPREWGNPPTDPPAGDSHDDEIPF